MDTARYRPARRRTPKVRGEDTLNWTAIADQAVRALIRKLKLDRSRDIPYGAGSSRDGKTIYVDKRMPKTVRVRGKDIPTAPFLMVHEAVEKLLFDGYHLRYRHAHQLAQRLEQALVRNAGVPWARYNKLMQKALEETEHERRYDIPRDLEPRPYRDEGEAHLLEPLKKHPKRRGRPPG